MRSSEAAIPKKEITHTRESWLTMKRKKARKVVVPGLLLCFCFNLLLFAFALLLLCCCNKLTSHEDLDGPPFQTTSFFSRLNVLWMKTSKNRVQRVISKHSVYNTIHIFTEYIKKTWPVRHIQQIWVNNLCIFLVKIQKNWSCQPFETTVFFWPCTYS